jgi:hypothetical protein
MDSTNNEIYKIAKYLDKYRKESNKEGGVYLQKLDNYLHKVQHGGNGEIVKLAEDIGRIVTEVVRVHQQTKSKLQSLAGDVERGGVEAKIRALREQISGLEETIARKKIYKQLTSMTDLQFVDLLDSKITVGEKKVSDDDVYISFSNANIYDDLENYESWTGFYLLKKLFSQKYFKENINIAKNITKALLQIKADTLENNQTQEIGVLDEIYRMINRDGGICKDIKYELFIEFFSNENGNLSDFDNYLENSWKYLVVCEGTITKNIVAKEVCKRLEIYDDKKISEIVTAYDVNGTMLWSVDSSKTFVPFLKSLYKSKYFRDNAIFAMEFAMELVNMQWFALKKRKEDTTKVNAEITKFSQVKKIIVYLSQNKSEISLFIVYIKTLDNTFPTLNAFKSYVPEFSELTGDILMNLDRTRLSELVYKHAGIEKSADSPSLQAYISRVGAANYEGNDWTFKHLFDDLYTEQYYQKNINELMQIIKSTLQIKQKALGGVNLEITEVEILIKYLISNPDDISNLISKLEIYLSQQTSETFNFDTFLQFIDQESSAAVPASSAASPALASSAAAPAPVSPASPAPPAPKAMTYDSLISDKFDVVGYTVEKTSGKVKGKIVENEVKFSTKEIFVGREQKPINVLIEEQQQSILGALQLQLQLQLTDIKEEDSFKVTKAGVRIVLQKPVNIRNVVNSINEKHTIVSLTKHGQYDNVRLFIKPMKDWNEQNPINSLADEITKEIREIVQQPPSEQSQGSAAPLNRSSRGRAQSSARGGSMSSRGPYRHPSSPSTPPTP